MSEIGGAGVRSQARRALVRTAGTASGHHGRKLTRAPWENGDSSNPPKQLQKRMVATCIARCRHIVQILHSLH